MDNENLNQSNASQDKLRGLLNKRNILIVLAVFIIAEALWALWVIYGTDKKAIPISPPATAQSQPTLVQLQSDKLNVKVGEKFKVSINVLSDKETDGADLIINYDPKIVSAVINKGSNAPVNLSNIYADYPVNSLDKVAGKITVSGISTTTNSGKLNGLFGSIDFSAEAAGMAEISLEFVSGSTIDSNIIEKGTGQDILESVQNIVITISP